jgi:UTP--glucose-1-phosphate uridylyltransferase
MTLRERNKKAELTLLEEDLPVAGATSFIRQQSPLGLGHAVWCAREIAGNEPFALLLPDVLVQAEKSCLAQMVSAYDRLGKANLLAVEEVPQDRTHMYGVVGMGERSGNALKIPSSVEKPATGTAPSNRIITGRYILQPEIFEFLAKQERGAGGEIQITDAMIALAKTQPFYGYDFEGRTFDCGSKIGFLSANVSYALARPDLNDEFRNELKSLL